MFACNENNEPKNKAFITNSSKSNFEFYFADTVQVNKTYRGLVLYDSSSAIDSITDKLEHEKDTIRLLAFFLKNSKTAIKDSADLIVNDPKSNVFMSNTPDSIYFEYKFKDTGYQFLEGVLQDEITYATFDKEYPVNVTTENIHISCPVYVTDNLNFKNKLGSVIRKLKNGKTEDLLYELNN
ncbi:hypothetical protein [Lacinutrix sp. Hel_I_90]|uniref:hypothetical protein n=1 Tax=Lacinutrix sp. Hel_I_90 TaxID=1249999 RepID=UPI0012E03F29|nr:hypothetical protein [Lacinutrix sp. Hel_I_90]